MVSSAHTQVQREIESILPFVQVERIGVGRRIAVRASETGQRLHDERATRQRVLPSLHMGDGLTIGGPRGREITLIECGPAEGDEADDAIRVTIHVVALLDVFERGQTTLARLVQPAHPSEALSVKSVVARPMGGLSGGAINSGRALERPKGFVVVPHLHVQARERPHRIAQRGSSSTARCKKPTLSSNLPIAGPIQPKK